LSANATSYVPSLDRFAGGRTGESALALTVLLAVLCGTIRLRALPANWLRSLLERDVAYRAGSHRFYYCVPAFATGGRCGTRCLFPATYPHHTHATPHHIPHTHCPAGFALLSAFWCGAGLAGTGAARGAGACLLATHTYGRYCVEPGATTLLNAAAGRHLPGGV